MAKGLTVDGHVLQAQGARQGLDPRLEATPKGLGIEAIKKALEGIMGGDAVGEGQESLQPGAPASPKVTICCQSLAPEMAAQWR